MFKKLFCKHKNIRCLTNLYGDFINCHSTASKICRSVWLCKDCGKVIKKERLEPSCKTVNFSYDTTGKRIGYKTFEDGTTMFMKL